MRRLTAVVLGALAALSIMGATTATSALAADGGNAGPVTALGGCCHG